MGGHECYHCKQWVEEGEAHDCWTTTEAALTADLSEDLREAWERLRETTTEFGDQRVYASHRSIMFSRGSCYCFVRPKRTFLELNVFLGRTVDAPQVRRVDRVSKAKLRHTIPIRHRDEVEAPVTDWLAEAYALSGAPAVSQRPRPELKENRPDQQAEAMNEQNLHQWRERELQRRLVEEAEGRTETLAPPDAFSDAYAPETPEDRGRRGRNSRTVEGILGGGCCGWREQPDAAELYGAMRAVQPTKRQMAVAGALISEADIDDLLTAHLEGAFTWRQLATMIHRLRMETSELSTYLNKRATRARTPPPAGSAEVREGGSR